MGRQDHAAPTGWDAEEPSRAEDIAWWQEIARTLGADVPPLDLDAALPQRGVWEPTG